MNQWKLVATAANHFTSRSFRRTWVSSWDRMSRRRSGSVTPAGSATSGWITPSSRGVLTAGLSASRTRPFGSSSRRTACASGEAAAAECRTRAYTRRYPSANHPMPASAPSHHIRAQKAGSRKGCKAELARGAIDNCPSCPGVMTGCPGAIASIAWGGWASGGTSGASGSGAGPERSGGETGAGCTAAGGTGADASAGTSTGKLKPSGTHSRSNTRSQI